MVEIACAYLLRLRALQVAIGRVKEACNGEEIDVAAIEAHAALDCVYDLHEVHFLSEGIRTIDAQDAHLSDEEGQVVGALALARGAKTHKLMKAARVGGFGDLPYGMGPFGGGWIWAEFAWSSPKFSARAGWYEERVKWRYLWNPLEEALWWFTTRAPAKGASHGTGDDRRLTAGEG